MIDKGKSQKPEVTTSAPFLPLLLLLFVGSGCAALIYEIVWFQLLQLVIGSSAVSLGVLLGTFMGGMCLGSLALPRFISPRRHPLRVYAFLEFGIGIIGVLVLFVVPHVSRIYTANAAEGLAGMMLRGVVCAVCLLPPTLLMGATLPGIARWIETSPHGISWLGFFYGGNITGAVFGCLLAGFYLLRIYDMATATYVAAAINLLAATIAFSLAALTPHRLHQSLAAETRPEAGTIPDQSPIANRQSPIQHELALSAGTPNTGDTTTPRAARPAASWSVYTAIALSGLCALGAEVIWTRLLSLMLGGTVYTFSIILAGFLVGLGIGSSIGSVLARGILRPRVALAFCQLLLCGAIAWSAFMIAKSLPYWPINPSLSKSPWLSFQLDLVRCFWAILPPTILWGASFPLALAAVASHGEDAGRLVGRVYAANTVGAIVGAVGFSILLIASAGTQHAQQVLIGVSALAALVGFAPSLSRLSAASRFSAAVLLVIASGSAVLLAWKVPQIPGGLVAHGRHMATKDGEGKILFMGEGMNSSVAVTELSSGVRNFHVSGKVEASTEPQDMRLQRMLGHIPALLHPKPRSVLIVGCGAGVTAGSFVVHPGIEKVVICEIEPLIPGVAAHYFAKENYNVLKDPRVKVIFDDARHYVLTTKKKFDIITSDPIHPWVKGAATLYTKEYFEHCKEHLNPGGLITQWVPLYESKLDVVKSEIATFFDVFPKGTIWSNDTEGYGYDTVLLGQAGTMRINVDELQQRLERQDHLAVAQSLSDVGFRSAVDLLSTYAGCGTDLRPWLKNAEINRDGNLRLQYLAGMGLNSNQTGSIYAEMIVHRKSPDELFIASDERRQELRKALGLTPSDQ